MVDYNKSIKDVSQIMETHNTINTIDDLDKFVEEPCLDACKDFYQKNLITIQSSGNYIASESSAWITVDTSTMDKNNLQIVKELITQKQEINGKKIKLTYDDSMFTIDIPLN